MEAEIRRSSTDWTIVRPPKLVNKPLTGRYRTVVGGNVPRGYSARGVAALVVKMIAAVPPLMALRCLSRPARDRTAWMLAWAEAAILIVYGLVQTAAGLPSRLTSSTRRPARNLTSRFTNDEHPHGRLWPTAARSFDLAEFQSRSLDLVATWATMQKRRTIVRGHRRYSDSRGRTLRRSGGQSADRAGVTRQRLGSRSVR